MKSKSSWLLKAVSMLLALCLTFSLAGCSELSELVSGVTAQAGEFPVEVNGVTISSKPQAVVVLSPSLADVILALGCETQLAAASEDCTQDSLSSLTKIDAGSPENLLSGLTPDLVIAESFSDDMADFLSENGITALTVSSATDREDFERLYSQVSSALLGSGTGYDEGISTAQDIFTTLDDINRIVPSDKITTACYLYDLSGRAVTGDSLADTIMSYAGVTNVFSSLTGGEYDTDTLLIANPDYIFCAPGLKEEIESNSELSSLNAVQNGNIYELDESYMEWQGRTVIMTAYEISEKCFPELTEENSMTVTDPVSGIEERVESQLSEASEDETEYSALTEGDQNDDVFKMQQRLEELGYLDAEYDGYYGSYTAGCVSEFQSANGLEATGTADPDTLKLLYSSEAKAKGESTESDEGTESSEASADTEASESSASESSES